MEKCGAVQSQSLTKIEGIVKQRMNKNEGMARSSFCTIILPVLKAWKNEGKMEVFRTTEVKDATIISNPS